MDAPAEFGDLIERFDHIAVAVHDIGAILPLVELLGGRFRNGGDSRNGFRWAQWHLPGGAKIEFLQPLDPEDADHFLNRFLAANGEGLHHVTFKVRSVTEAAERARARGYRVVGLNLDRPYWREMFLHPKSAHGILIQMAEWTDRPDPGRTIEDVIGA